MARKKRNDVDADASKVTRIKKRAVRTGVKRAMNLVMLDSNCVRLEALAILRKTSPAEIVQDLVEAATIGMRLSVPGLRVLGEGPDPAGNGAGEPEGGEAA